MRFDLTREVVLSEKDEKIYRRLRMLLYLAALLLVVYFSLLILFPSQFFTFSFINPKSNDNTLINPRDSLGVFPERGRIAANKNLYFDAALTGTYSETALDFSLAKKPSASEIGFVEVRKSYQAFFYPDGGSMGFKDGALLKNKTDYYLVSNGQLRKFADASIVSALGFRAENFLAVDEEDLKYNSPGASIADKSAYPDNSLFKIAENYYMLSGGKLIPFVSEKAFLSHYPPAFAINQSDDFLGKYPVDENLLGFSSGSIVSYGISAYLIENGTILPINNPETFLAMGYDWSGIVPIDGGEFSLYEKGELTTIESAHPEGTVFSATEDGKKYLIKNGRKYFLPTESIAASWIGNKGMIAVNARGLEISQRCVLQKKLLSSVRFSCAIPLASLQSVIGKDYEFKVIFSDNLEISNINATFEKNINKDNFKMTVFDLVNRIKQNYVPQS